jgi:hypothetical protein
MIKKTFVTLLAIFSIFLFVGVSEVHAATNWHVSTIGSNSNSGEQSSPFLTLDYALKKAVPGDTIYLAEGTYATDSTTVTHGTADSHISVIGSGDSDTIISGKLTIQHSYYNWQNIKFTTNYVSLRGSGASYNIFTGNQFTAAPKGIDMSNPETIDGTTGPSFNVITDNEFFSPTGDGMVTLVGHDNLVANNIFRDGDGWDALRVWGLNQTIRDNQFLRINADGINHVDIIQTWKSSASLTARKIIFERNIIKNSTGQFGNLEGGSPADMGDWTFRNNIFLNSRIQLNNYLPDVKVYNNTVYGTPAVSPTGFRFTGSSTRGYAHNGQVYNNIFIGDGGFYAFHVDTIGTTANNNIISNLNGSAKDASQEGADGINGGFVPGDIFIDLNNFDLKLKSSSIAVDAGASLSDFNTDIINTIRPQGLKWDIGAYEYCPTGCGETPPPSDTISPSIPTNLSATPISTTQVNLTWTASTDNVAVTGYKVYRGGTQLTTVSNTSYTDTNLLPSTTYTYTVSSYDAANNNSSQSSAVSGTTNTLPPSPTTKFTVGDRVKVTVKNLNVRATSSGSGKTLGKQYLNAQGTVVSGPTPANGYNWYYINYDKAPDGYSAENFLEKVNPVALELDITQDLTNLTQEEKSEKVRNLQSLLAQIIQVLNRLLEK